MLKKQLALTLLTLSAISGLAAWFGNVWIAAPFGLCYALLIPGYLMLLGLRRKIDNSWTSVVYAVGLGITFLMFASLSTNSIGKALGIGRPLSHGLLMSGIAISTLILLTAYKRWNDRPIEYVRITLTREQKLVVIISTFTLLGFIAGSMRLNNGASGTISLICYLTTPALFIYMIIRARSLNNGVIIYALWMLGLGVLLSGSLRSLYVSGPDISLEYAVSQLIKTTAYWSIDTFRNGYNACLSIGLFAPSLSILTKLSVASIYKFLVPTLYTLIVPVVYLITRRFIGIRGSLITAFFFISQPVFVVWWWIPERQQVALLLFSLLILLIVEKGSKSRSKTLMFLVLAAGLIVSHYSTALLAIGYFFLALIIKKLISYRRSSSVIEPGIVTPMILLIMIIGYFAWYSQITYGFNGVVEFTTKSFSNISRLFSNDNQAGGQGLLSQFNIFANPNLGTTSFSDYVTSSTKSSTDMFGSNNLYESNYDTHQTTIGIENTKPVMVVKLLRRSVIILGKLTVVGGVIVMSFIAWNTKKRTRYALLALPAIILLGATIALPFFSISYDQVRTFQQMLICTGGIYGLALILPSRFKTIGNYILCTFAVVYFVLVSGTWAYFTTSLTLPAGLGNNSYDYVYYFVHTSDTVASKWLKSEVNSNSNIVADNFAVDKLRLSLDPQKSSAILQSLVPSTIPKDSYVVATNTNIKTSSAFASVNNNLISYSFPSDFLAVNKNVVYNNGGDIIYK